METRATTLMRAHCEETFGKVLAAIRAREREPFKVPPPELGIDLASIRRTCIAAQRRALLRDAILTALYIAALMLLMPALQGGGFEENMAAMEAAAEPAVALPMGILAALYGAMVAVCLAFSAIGRVRARKTLKQMSFTTEDHGEDPTPERTEVIVSGGFSPFTGSGEEAVGWSFTIDLTEPADPGKPILPFNLHALYDDVEARLARLLDHPAAVRSVLFVDGRDVQSIEPLMPDGQFAQPAHDVRPEQVPLLMSGRDRILRHYKCLRSLMWGGQLPISTFYRFTPSGEALFCEARILVLRPLNEGFRTTERLPARMTATEGLQLVARALVEPVWRWAAILAELSNWLQGGWLESAGGESRRRRRNSKLVRADRRYNYGWPTSLREQWSANSTYERYFQQVDQDFHVKMVQEALLSTLLSRLEMCNVNTESFKGASHRIVNEGIIISGGTVKTESMTAGRRARSTLNKMMGRAPHVARAA